MFELFGEPVILKDNKSSIRRHDPSFVFNTILQGIDSTYPYYHDVSHSLVIYNFKICNAYNEEYIMTIVYECRRKNMSLRFSSMTDEKCIYGISKSPNEIMGTTCEVLETIINGGKLSDTCLISAQDTYDTISNLQDSKEYFDKLIKKYAGHIDEITKLAQPDYEKIEMKVSNKKKEIEKLKSELDTKITELDELKDEVK